MNKKLCLISDMHFGVNKNSELFLNNSVDFCKNELVPYLKKEHITHIVVLGDVFDNRNTINVKIIDEVHNVFGNILAEFDVTILIGNHDIYYKTTIDVHSLKSLDLLPNVEIIDKITHKDIFGITTLFCPWIVDYNDEEFNNVLETSESDVLFGHFDIVGFALNRTRISTEGVDSDIFTNFKKVFSGHYHTPSSKRIGSTEISYIGSPYQMNRNDMDEPKGIIILNLETLRYKRVVTKSCIEFKSIEYPEIPLKEDIEGNIVDAIITIDKHDIVGNMIDKYIDKIESMNPIEKVNVIMNVISDNSVDFDSMIHGKMTSIPDLIELYINNDDDIKDKEEVLVEIMKIYEEVG